MHSEHAAQAGARDAVAAAALTVVRRAMVEGTPVTRTTLEHEAAVVMDMAPADAMAEVEAEAQRLGVSCLG